MNRTDLHHRLPEIVQSLVSSVLSEDRMKHLDRVYLPSRDVIIKGIDLLRQLIFPGYFGKQGLTTENLSFRIGELTNELTDLLYDQVRCCLRYRKGISAGVTVLGAELAAIVPYLEPGSDWARWVGMEGVPEALAVSRAALLALRAGPT